MSRNEDRDAILKRIVEEDKTLLERLDKSPMFIDEYVEKLERFVELWKAQSISDAELSGAIKQLSNRVVVIDGNYIQG